MYCRSGKGPLLWFYCRTSTYCSITSLGSSSSFYFPTRCVSNCRRICGSEIIGYVVYYDPLTDVVGRRLCINVCYMFMLSDTNLDSEVETLETRASHNLNPIHTEHVAKCPPIIGCIFLFVIYQLNCSNAILLAAFIVFPKNMNACPPTSQLLQNVTVAQTFMKRLCAGNLKWPLKHPMRLPQRLSK